MGNELSVYKQLTLGTKECLDVIKREIGMKTTCLPFAVKATEALATLDNVKTEQEQLNAANVFLSTLQTLMQGGIVAEDYDKIDFVKRGKTIVLSARVEAFYRAARRKGYIITDTIIAVPKEDFETTYFEEQICNGGRIYMLKDKRYNADREITAQRLIDKYFSKFICRLEVQDARNNKIISSEWTEMYIDDLLSIAATSSQGFYKTYWNDKLKKKVPTDELNPDAFWVKWTGEMVNKTVIRRALKRIKEVLPELTETIYAFEQDADVVPETEIVEAEARILEIPIETEDVDLNKLTAEQMEECKEVLKLWKANPKLAEDKLNEVKDLIESGKTAQEIVNEDYASVYILKMSPQKWAVIGGYFENEKS